MEENRVVWFKTCLDAIPDSCKNCACHWCYLPLKKRKWGYSDELKKKYLTQRHNDDCHYYFDVCRSVAIRRYNSEINKINRILKMLAKEYGFDEVYCSAVFGNGEAIYTKVENTQRARIVRAIKEIA